MLWAKTTRSRTEVLLSRGAPVRDCLKSASAMYEWLLEAQGSQSGSFLFFFRSGYRCSDTRESRSRTITSRQRHQTQRRLDLRSLAVALRWTDWRRSFRAPLVGRAVPCSSSVRPASGRLVWPTRRSSWRVNGASSFWRAALMRWRVAWLTLPSLQLSGPFCAASTLLARHG